ncbi:hypothetical protein Moror_1630 [Moniliophthora roreri MCA 2997]|uniref:Uncharacterized protein n=1 Tax=Moniliophthora roreri (strain MCA 2997) TaxID=1381753 RepID=V2X326_MONRO|nr:hypothetical protein Moror_1630 [Moniliophthora roreri MCA 2997]
MQPAAAAPRTTTTYVHYTSPSAAATRTVSTTTPTPVTPLPTTVAPKDVTFKSYTPQPQPTAARSQPTSVAPASTVTTPTAPTSAVMASSSSAPASASTGVTAQGDWTKDLVHLAKTAELKKHALTLQLHTAHILSSQALLDQKNRAIQDVKEQKNKLDSERTRLLESLRQVNEDRDKVDMLQGGIEKECSDLRAKILQLSEGEYAAAKSQVDKLRQELGQSPLPSLQTVIEEKKSQYLNERRLNATTSSVNASAPAVGTDGMPPGKRPRGRPKGSKNRKGSG